MNIVLLSGGSGERLWPLSNDVRSKQFIKIFKGENGQYESMVQRVYRQIKKAENKANVIIATSETQVSAIRNQLGEDVGISIEPCRRDTFPAIVLATAYMHYIQGVSLEESVVVCPVDPYVEDTYFEALKTLGEQAAGGEAKLVLMGIEPRFPSENYGYIIPCEKKDVSWVDTFKEKPDVNAAREYICMGALWNSGVFAYKLGYVLERAHELTDFIDYTDLYAKYGTLKKISFDYAVVEKESNIQVMRYNGEWKDIGTWDTLTEVMEEPTIGQATFDEGCNNVYAINELDMPILCVGLRDVVVSASPSGILVADKKQSSSIKPYVEQLKGQIMFAEKSWGTFKVIDVEEKSLTIKVSLRARDKMHYHSHERRDEIWNIISGKGLVIVDGMEQPVKPGDVITIAAGCKHTIIAETEMKIIEMQLGKEISVHDKQIFKMEN